MLRGALAGLALSRDHRSLHERTSQAMVEMRDGVKLHTRLAYPKDYDPKNPGATKFTSVVDRSPYTAAGLELMADIYVPTSNFIALGQDMRGTGKSEGEFTMWHSDGNDSYDFGEWIVQQPWSDGKVYSIGASADGLGSFTMNENEAGKKWLAAQYIIWASAHAYEVIFPNGAYLENLVTRWLDSTVEDGDKYVAQVKQYELHDPWWDFLNYTGKYDHMHQKSAHWLGWWDIFLGGHITSFHGYQYESDPAVRGQSVATIDPLGHCQDAADLFPQNLIMGRTALSLMQSFELYGTREVKRPFKAVTFYVMSSNDEAGLAAGNYWTTLDYFPEYIPVKYYMHADGTLSKTMPTFKTTPASSYVYDPSADPIPTVGGANLFLSCGPLDQSSIEQSGRTDMVMFTSDVFDSEMALTGPLTATLFVGSSALDTDFMVKITDVYPDGQSRLLQDSAITMRNRLKTEYSHMEAGKVYEVEMTLWNTSYVVAPGHSLRVTIASSNYPRFGINRNNGLPLSNQYDAEPVVATNSLYHSLQYPSHITLPFVFKAQLPETHIPLEVQKALPEVDVERVIREKKDLNIWESILAPYRAHMEK